MKSIKCLLMILALIGLVGCGYGKDRSDNKFTKQILEPTSGTIEEIDDFESSIIITVKDLTQGDFREYVEQCEKRVLTMLQKNQSMN